MSDRGLGLQSRAARAGLLLAVAVVTAAVLPFAPRISQPPAYHNFADQRPLFGIPHALNVLSNVPFLFVGLAGLLFIWRQPPYPSGRHFVSAAERRPWQIFFLGVALTCCGSAWYHLAPDNARLVWDRLPMTLGFMSLCAAMIVERIDLRAGLWLLGPLLLAGLGSVLYWHWTELSGAGDLRPYVVVQFFPLLAIPLMLLLFPARYTGTAEIWIALLWYGLAKLLEELDGHIYGLTGQTLSGHSLKHLAAAASAWWLLRMLRRRLPVARSDAGLDRAGLDHPLPGNLPSYSTSVTGRRTLVRESPGVTSTEEIAP